MATRIGPETEARIAGAWQPLLADIAAGELIKDALVAHGISRPEVRAYLASVQGAREQWDDAREASSEAFMDEALECARTSNSTQVEAADARTRIDTLKWAARIRNPRVYSDKSTVDLNVRTVDLTRIISDANARLAASRAIGRTIEGEVIQAALADLL